MDKYQLAMKNNSISQSPKAKRKPNKQTKKSVVLSLKETNAKKRCFGLTFLTFHPHVLFGAEVLPQRPIGFDPV